MFWSVVHQGKCLSKKKKRKKEKQQNREEKPVPTVMEIKKLTGEVRTKIIYTIIFQILKPLCFIDLKTMDIVDRYVACVRQLISQITWGLHSYIYILLLLLLLKYRSGEISAYKLKWKFEWTSVQY